MSDEEFELEKVLDKRTKKGGKVESLVKWREYDDPDANTLKKEEVKAKGIKGKSNCFQNFRKKLREKKKDVPMDVKDIKKIEIVSTELKMEDLKMKKIKVELYCVLCQTYGHILTEACVARAICFDCGIKGHTRRDCKEDRSDLKIEIKFEKVKEESSNSENEYVEEEIPKEEQNNDMELESVRDTIEIRKDSITSLNMSEEYIEEDVEDKKNIKVEAYCILCQMHGHIYAEACVVNAVCFLCGVKGHVRRDCKDVKCELKHLKLEIKNERVKYEKEYVEVEIDKSEPKTEMNLEESNFLSPVKQVEYWSKKRKDNAKVINEETNETYNNSNLRSSKTLNEFTSSSKDTSYLKDTFVHTNDVKGEPEIETIGDDMPNISDEDAHSKLKKPYMYSCAQCDYKSKLKGNLRNHQMGMHLAVWHKCDQCDYKSRWIVSLKRHVEVAHKELSYPCQNCDYKGTSRRTLKLHLAQHEGVTYNCDQCVKKYKYKFNLEAHKVSAHVCGGEKRFSCDQCDYKAKWKRNVKEHKEFVHEGITYSCDQCDYKAKNKFLLKRHLEIVHKGLRHVGK